MDLKSGVTLWTRQNQPPSHYPKLRQDAVCDVVIVGAGITGALVAHELIARGCKVIVVDKRVPVTGSTSASTALLLYETDSSLADLTRWHGRSAAVRTYALGRRAIRELGAMVKSLRLDCGFQRKKCLYLASDRRGLALLKREFTLRRRAKLPVSFLSRRQLRAQFGLPHEAAIYSSGCAQVDAVRLAQGLLDHHCRRGDLHVFEKTPVTAISSEANHVQVRTENGFTVDARQVVIATGYETTSFLTEGLVQLHSSYVVASRPQARNPPWKDGCLIWETARPYLYLRTTDDHRVLIGGADEPFADPRRRDAKLPGKQRLLLRKFRRLFPAVAFEPEFAWTGTFGESSDGLPYIGAMKSAPHVLYALGYGGNGITFSQIAAKIIGRICTGSSHRDAHLFRFDR